MVDDAVTAGDGLFGDEDDVTGAQFEAGGEEQVDGVGAIEAIKGNTQRATIQFSNTDLEIPLSKSYYKEFKSALSS